jgi:hypothetical protein
MFKQRLTRGFLFYWAVLGFFAFVVTLVTSCAAYNKEQTEQRSACRDETLAAIVAECTVEIKATPNATEKNKLRRVCLERVDAWEQCQ